MTKIVLEGPGDTSTLPDILEGFLYGIGEVCHALFGAEGMDKVYRAVGKYYLDFLAEKQKISFESDSPWERYCQIIEFFTGHGFYKHVELKELPDGRFYMLESGQYAGAIWEEQKSWERGSAPCPSWSVLICSLQEIGYAIVLDSVNFRKDCDGFESTFHFEKMDYRSSDVLETARNEIRKELVPICSKCKKIRNSDNEWISFETFFSDTLFTHSYCPDCAEEYIDNL